MQTWDELKAVVATVAAGQKQGMIDLRSVEVHRGELILSRPFQGVRTLELSDHVRDTALNSVGVSPKHSATMRESVDGIVAQDKLLQWAMRSQREKYAYLNGRVVTALHDGAIAISSERLVAAIERASNELHLDAVPRNVFVQGGSINAQIIARSQATKDVTAARVGSMLYPGMNLWSFEDRPDKSGIEAFLFRGICTNGMIFGRTADNFKRLYTSNASQRALEQEMMTALSGSVRQGQKVATVALELSRQRVTNPEKLITALAKSLKLDRHRAPLLLGAWQREPHASRWGVVNAITRFSQSEADPQARWQLERFAGQLVSEDARWQQVSVIAA